MKKFRTSIAVFALAMALGLGLYTVLYEAPQPSLGISASSGSGPEKPQTETLSDLTVDAKPRIKALRNGEASAPTSASLHLDGEPGEPAPKSAAPGARRGVMKGAGPGVTRALQLIDPEQQRKQIDAATGPRSSLTGRIVDRQARPIARALVELIMVDRSRPMPIFAMQLPGLAPQPPIFSVNSAEDGRFEFKAMPLEFAYQIRASKDEEFLENTVPAPALLNQEKTPVGDIPLDRPASLEGLVLSEDGKPIAGALVKIQEKLLAGTFEFEDEDEESGVAKSAVMIVRATETKDSNGNESMRVFTNLGPSTRSDEQGRFRFEKLKPGAYVLGAAKKGFRKLSSQPIDLAESQTARGVELRLGQPGRIFVKVTDEAGRPIVGAAILRRSNAMMFVARLGPASDSSNSETPIHTDSEGIALLEGIDSTEVAVEASAPGFATATKTVTMSGFEASIEINLLRGRMIKGRLIDSKSKAPIAEVMLSLLSQDSKPPAAMNSYNAVSDSEGRFEFGPLRPGEYTLSSIVGNGSYFLRQKIELPAGDSPLLLPDIELSGGREVLVTVFDPQGKAISGAEVRAYAAETAGVRTFRFASMMVDNRSDELGQVTLTDLEPTRSHISASKAGFGTGWLTDVDLSDPTLRQLDVRLFNPASLEGSLLDEQGQALARTTISLLRPGIFQPVASIDTDSEGRFRFQDLGPGQYYLLRGAFPRANKGERDLITIVEGEKLVRDITLP